MNMIQIKTHNLESNAVEGRAIPPLPPPAFPQLKTSAAVVWLQLYAAVAIAACRDILQLVSCQYGRVTVQHS